jgi:hypothetical protein
VLESWAVRWARGCGIIRAKLTACDGIPDSIFFIPGGSPVIVEFKKKGKVGSGLQQLTQPWYWKKLTELGYKVYKCDSKEQFLEIMKEYESCQSVIYAKNVTQKTAAASTKARREQYKTKRSKT